MQPTLFKHGEAESLVRELRHQLQESYVLNAQGEDTASQMALWRAYDIRDELLDRLKPRIWADAVARLQGYPETVWEDALIIALEYISADLMNLNISDSATSRAYEKWFNGIVDKRIRNALRTVRRQERYYEGRPLSLDSPIGTNENSTEGEALSESVENRDALAELESIFDAEILQCFRNALSPEQLEIVRLHIQHPELSATKLGQILGISDRTARYRLESAEKLLVSIIQGRK